MANVEKQEKIEDERKIMKNKKKKLGGIKTMPFIFGIYVYMFAFQFFCSCLVVLQVTTVFNFLLLFLFGIFQETLS